MFKPASYPFMNIAKKYGYPYADVLIFADSLRMMHGTTEKQHQDKWGPRQIAAREIWYAIKEFRAIQRGEIDWNTGEPARHDNGMLKSIPMAVEGEAEPGEHAEIIHALDYRNHDDDE